MKTITICGSIRFCSEMDSLRDQLLQAGFAVFAPQNTEQSKNYLTLPKQQQQEMKLRFIDTHLNKIRHSDAILVANYTKNGIDGYVGANTLMEIAFAYVLQKKVFVLFPVGKQGCQEEVEVLSTDNLHGDISKLSTSD